MTKRAPFPVMKYKVKGSRLSETQRVSAINSALEVVLRSTGTPASKKKTKAGTKVKSKMLVAYYKQGDIGKLQWKDTATGSGNIVFACKKKSAVSGNKKSA